MYRLSVTLVFAIWLCETHQPGSVRLILISEMRNSLVPLRLHFISGGGGANRRKQSEEGSLCKDSATTLWDRKTFSSVCCSSFKGRMFSSPLKADANTVGQHQQQPPWLFETVALLDKSLPAPHEPQYMATIGENSFCPANYATLEHQSKVN